MLASAEMRDMLAIDCVPWTDFCFFLGNVVLDNVSTSLALPTRFRFVCGDEALLFWVWTLPRALCKLVLSDDFIVDAYAPGSFAIAEFCLPCGDLLRSRGSEEAAINGDAGDEAENRRDALLTGFGFCGLVAGARFGAWGFALTGDWDVPVV